jgi:hypothetical protein
MNPSRTPSSATAPLLLTLKCDRGSASRFLPLLSQGFRVACATGDTLEAVLGRELGITPDYLQERVQTAFFNGRPIDDLHSATVSDGATIALSAAMPGLAGAVLRRGGVYAPMRGQSAETPAAAGGQQEITVKLFNMVARELGPGILEQGIRLSAAALRDFIERLGDVFRELCRGGEAGGRSLDSGGVAAVLAAHETVVFRLELGA